MVHSSTLRILTTRVRAGILTFLSDACEIIGTLGIANAFWSTIRGRTNVSVKARARWGVPISPTFRVRTTWRWMARVNRITLYWYLNNRLASNEGISCVPCRTATDRVVVDNHTLCTHSTCAWAWISAFLIDARLQLWAIRIDYTLGSAIGRTSNIARNARAHGLVINLSALTVLTTWRWMTGV